MRLEANDLVVTRDRRRILDSLSVTFAEPGLVAVIGPNGAGKSTLLLALAGLLKPDQGAVTLDGAPVLRMDPRALAHRRAYLPQNARCDWPITVENAVALGLTPTAPAFGGMQAPAKACVSIALEDSDLIGNRDQPVTTLSGGELARAMLARAMVGDPEILIADEPVAGLDFRHALDAMRRLRARADGGRLVIVALHDLMLAARYADRVVALQTGRIVADGAPEGVFSGSLPKDLFEVDIRVVRDAEGISLRFLDPT